MSAFGEPKVRGWSGEQRTTKLPCLPSSAPHQLPNLPPRERNYREKPIEVKWAPDSVRAAQALRPAASCTSAPSGPQTCLPTEGESRDKLRKKPSPMKGEELRASGSASALSHRIRTVYVN